MPRGEVLIVDDAMSSGPLGGVVAPKPIAIGSVERMFVALSVRAGSELKAVELNAFDPSAPPAPDDVIAAPAPIMSVAGDELATRFAMVTFLVVPLLTIGTTSVVAGAVTAERALILVSAISFYSNTMNPLFS